MTMPHRDTSPIEPALLSVADVARLLSTSRTQVRNMRARGQLPPPIKIAGLGLRWPRAEFMAWLQEQASASPLLAAWLTCAQVSGHALKEPPC